MPSAHLPTPLLAVLGACLALWATALGCGASDPLEEIRALQQSGRFGDTIEPLRELLAERPDDSEVEYRYGLALARTGQPSLADWSLSEAMKDPEWLVPAGQQLVFDALGSGNHDRAIEITSKILESEPDNVDVLLLRANAYARSRMHLEEALADADRLLALDPESPEAMEPKILALLGLERIDEAREAIDELGKMIEESQLGPESEGWYCATTAIFADDSDEEELARERWADCLERFPGHGNVLSGGLKFYDARGEYARSIEILQAALAAVPESRSYRIRLTNRLRLAGRADESEKLLREATGSEHPQIAALAWFDLAKHFQDMGDNKQAAEAQERAVAISRDAGLIHPQLLLEYADSLVLANEFDKALAVADEMTVEAHAEMIRARVAQQQGKPEEALKHFEEAFRLWPDNPFARYYAAIAAEAVGDFDAAIESYRYSIRIAPDATDARTRLARLHLAEGRPAEALSLLRHGAQQAPLDLEGELLSLQLWGLRGRTANMLAQLQRIRAGSPHLLGKALASAALGVRDRSGPGAAVRMLGESAAVDLAEPSGADALRALVRFSFEAGRGGESRQAVDAALARHPEIAAFHEIQGLWLERDGRDAPAARRAYEAALAIDAKNPGALAGLGRLSEDSDRALELFARASEADPLDAGPAWAAFELLRATGRDAEAESQLEALLKLHPYHHQAAAALAELQLERGAASERTVELARRAARFGGAEEALELLGRVHRSRNEPELAAEAERRAQALRERWAAPG